MGDKMTILALIFTAQFLGIIGHWATRWLQGRTTSTFKDYILGMWPQTLESVFASLTSAFTIYASIPESLTGKPLVLILIGAYTAGYAFDSKLNRDKGDWVPEIAREQREIPLKIPDNETLPIDK
jgi:hypothetical protein